MIAAVANLSLARGTAYDVSLLIQDAAGVPLDLSAADLAATLKTGETVTSLDMTIAADGVVLVHIPPQGLGMLSWEVWLQAAPETILNLPNIPGGKKLIYPHIDLPLTAIENFRSRQSENPLFKTLADICERNHNVWCEEAETYLLEYYQV